MRKRKIYVFFLHTSDSMTWIPRKKSDKLSYFYHPSPFETNIIFKELFLIIFIKINYEISCIGKVCTGPSSQLWWSCLWHWLVSLQSLTNLAKTPNIGAMGVLSVPLEYYSGIFMKRAPFVHGKESTLWRRSLYRDST